MKDIDKIIFYNGAARGDNFINRGFIKYFIDNFISKTSIKCEYYSAWDSYFTKDYIQSFIYPSNAAFNDGVVLQRQNEVIVIKNKILYFNADVLANNKHYFNLHGGFNFITLYHVFKNLYDYFCVEMPILQELLPQVDYKKYNTKNINNHFVDKNNLNVFISTSVPRSDQSNKRSLKDFVIKISQKYKNINFYITDPLYKSHNVFYSNDIIYETNHPLEEYENQITLYGSTSYTKTPDMIECSYFSNFCDIIVGKSTGTYVFSLTKHNILSNKQFMGICTLPLCSLGMHNYNNNFHTVVPSDNGLYYDENSNIKLLEKLINEKFNNR
jgi:hypothetical protein